MGTAPDPPESSMEEVNPTRTLRRLSTTCSHDPPSIRERDQRGLEPTEYQISDSSSNLRKSSTTPNKHGGALVLYEPPESTESTSQETEEEPIIKNIPSKDPQGALALVSDQRVTKVSHSNPRADENNEDELALMDLALKPPRTEAPFKDTRFGFDHCYVTVPCKERLSVLFATLRRSRDRKVVVICSTWESAAFHAILFRQLEMLHVYDMHENMRDGGAARAYNDFVYQYPGILFASDISLREFDIPPNVDYLVQYEPTMNPTEYIYRMSNAKIYKTSAHKALLFLTPEEMAFLEHFDHIPNRELEARKVSEFQGTAEKLVAKHGELNEYAWKAFRAYMLAYENHAQSDIYNHSKIDEAGIRRSFGQPHLPEYSSKYFLEKFVEKNGTTEGKKEDEESQDQSSKDKHWSGKEKTWRKSAKPWTTRETKTWRHSRSK